MKYYSGFGHPNQHVPYGVLSKISNTLDGFDSCGNRFEQSLWQIKLVHNDWKALDTELDRVYNLLNDEPPLCKNRLIEDHQWESSRTYEAEAGLYVSDVLYGVRAQKVFNAANIYLQKGNWNFKDLLGSELEEVISTSLGVPSWKRPFASVPEYRTRYEFETSKDRIRRKSFEICVSHNDAFELELLLEHIDDLMSYAKIIDDNEQNILMEWQGDSIIAEEPGLWKGSISYDMLMQSAV